MATGTNLLGWASRRSGAGGDAPELSFFSTITTFGTATEVTVAELSVEAFFPADQVTAEALRAGRDGSS